MPKFELKVQAVIELGGEFEADSFDEACEAAKQELRANGEIGNLVAQEVGGFSWRPLS